MTQPFEGRQRELQWIGETVDAAGVRGDPFHFVHLYGPTGIGVTRLADEWILERERSQRPVAVWQLEKVFRFMPLADCIRQLLENRTLVGVHDDIQIRAAEEPLRQLVEDERRRQLSDGSLVLYRQQGGYRTGRGSGGHKIDAVFRRDVSKGFLDLWDRISEVPVPSGFKGTGALVVRVEQLLATPPVFQSWLGSDMIEHLKQRRANWPVVVLSTGRDAFPLNDNQAFENLSSNWVTQFRLEPLNRPDFFAFLGNKDCPREAWEWLYAECGGVPGRLEKAVARWHQRVQNANRDEGFEKLLPDSVRTPLPPHERLWLQAAAGFGFCREESLTLLLGKREAFQAMRYLRALPFMSPRGAGDMLEMELSLRVGIIDWMRRHQSPLLDECSEYGRLIEELVRWAPRSEDRMHLSYLAPLPDFDRNLLEAVFPG